MINIDLKPMLKGGISRYSLVSAVAKRSREITDEANERKAVDSRDILVEKPVSLAVEDFLEGRYVIKSAENKD